MHPDFYHLDLFLRDHLPQEWLVVNSELTTCQGKATFIRVEKPGSIPEKRLVCLVQLKEKEIIVLAPDILSLQATLVIRQVKEAIDTGTITPRCLTLTECPANCEFCEDAAPFYEEFLVSP